jgi:hypothetical protein
MKDEEEEQLVEDFAKVYNAFCKAPKGKEDEVMEKALDEVWERRDREKKAEQQQHTKKK